MRACKVDGCGKKYNCKGYCGKHYYRWKTHGDPLVSLKSGGLCSIDGCSSKIEARKLCPKHYMRLKTHGDPTIKSVKELSPKERIIMNSAIDTNTDCWIFIGNRVKNGYGQICINGKIGIAHRHSYVAFKGDIPGGLLVCHKCDNPSCVNPEHLFIGTHQDNSDDKIKKGRHNAAKGEKHYKSKLSATDVINIRSMAKDGLTENEIAKKFNIGRGAVSSIKRRQCWKHIQDEVK